MSWIILALAAATLAVLEHYWAPYALKALKFKGGCDRIMAQPGEVITWSGTVENTSRLPIPFVRLMEKFPAQSQVKADQGWVDSHCSHSLTQWYVEEKMSLRPRQSRTRKVQFTFSRRGRYELGSYQMSAGDLLGFREVSTVGDWQKIVIIPERSKSRKSIDALGGFLGDISVRRFVLEDPVLTVGFRDYTGREPMKAISWTRSATAGSLQVRQYDHTAEHHVVVLLNVEGASEEQLEACFRLVRTVCEELERKKIPYGFRTNGNLPGPVGKIFSLAEGLGERHVNTILYGLGQADGTCYSTFKALTERTLRHRKSNESYIVVTPALTERSRVCIRTLEAAVGSGVCVLTADPEVNR